VSVSVRVCECVSEPVKLFIYETEAPLAPFRGIYVKWKRVWNLEKKTVFVNVIFFTM
jgi:hypothetical protein